MDAARRQEVARIHGGRTPDYHMHVMGDLIGDVLESGARALSPVVDSKRKTRGGRRRSARRLSPTNSERMNRALVELSPSAFKIHCLLWKWRGAPARGHLPFFTIHSLNKFCSLTRPTVRRALGELVSAGWIDRDGYNPHHKNALFRLVAIRDVPFPGNFPLRKA